METPIRLDGWFLRGKAEDYNAEMQRSWRVSPLFHFAAKRLVIENLEVTSIKKVQGSVLDPIHVVAVFDLSREDSPPFFIREDEARILSSIIDRLTNDFRLRYK